MKIKIFAISTFLFALSFQELKAQVRYDVTIRFSNLLSGSSDILVAVYDKKEFFLTDTQFEKSVLTALPEGKNQMKFELPAGNYAIAVFQDMNFNSIFDKNWLGYPVERYGFSNNPTALFRAPLWDEASINVDENKELLIELK